MCPFIKLSLIKHTGVHLTLARMCRLEEDPSAEVVVVLFVVGGNGTTSDVVG